MTSNRFKNFIEADIKAFTEEQEDVNMKKKPSYDLKLFKGFLASEDGKGELQEIPATESQEFTITFVLTLLSIYIIKRKLNVEKILAVINATYAATKRKSEKKKTRLAGT